MLVVSKQQALDRWDSLPENLREELVSDANSVFIWQICETEHIADKKIYTISRIVGWVFMGFLHPEDMANEVRDALGIDIRVATSIASAINQRLFAPIRADIDKIYDPNTGGILPTKILEEVRPPMAESIPKSAPAPLPIISSAVPAPVMVPPVPKQESIKQTVEKAASSLDEFARFGKNSVPAPASAPTRRSPSSFRPNRSRGRYQTLRISGPPTTAENVMAGRKIFAPLPPRTAVVEFGGMPVPKPAPAPQFSAGPKVTVVRYGNENSAAPAMPPKPEPMRTITEITRKH